MKNGYFQFEIKDDGLYMNVHPAVDGGNPVAMEDVLFVLEKKNITNADLIAIKNAVLKGVGATVRVCSAGMYSTSEWMDLQVSPDGLIAVARFFPPFVGGNQMDLNEIIGDLKFRGINFGIQEQTINAYLTERDYGKKYVIAVGRKIVEGTDAVLEYTFDISKKALPKIKEDGTVDFYDLDTISHVKEGDVVARITREVLGKPGMDVYGNTLAPRKVERKIFRFGRGMHVSEDGLELISDINGHVTLDGDRVSVSNTFQVAADVGVGTGNIDYDGNVVVPGNVMTGFTVKATGDIEIRGIVEGASIIAGGNVILGRGMQGMQQGTISAGGSIVAKFLENAKSAAAEGDIKVGTILHSNVRSGGNIVVEGKNALIIGGTVSASQMIEAKNVGNEMGTSTTLSVGVSPQIKMRAEELRNRIKELNDEKDKLNQVLMMLAKKNEAGQLDKAKLELLKKTKESLDATMVEFAASCKEYSEVSEKIQENLNACIKVTGTCNQGVKLIIGETEMFVKESEKYCQFRKIGAEIKSSPL